MILIADDTTDSRDLYAEYFGTRGCSVVTACDGAGAVQAATNDWSFSSGAASISKPRVYGGVFGFDGKEAIIAHDQRAVLVLYTSIEDTLEE